nr:S26 family signal peptidase [uncultured Porphyromonas sp.]
MVPKDRIKKKCPAWKYYALPLFFIILVVLLRLWVGFVYHVPKENEALGKYAGRYHLMVRIGSPKRGELVLAILENKGKRRDTHRLPLLVAGLPGDTIESYAGIIYVNGKSWYSANAQRNTSSEPKHTASTLSDTPSLTSNGADSSYYRLVLRPNEFWLLTYSIRNTMDSRQYGPIHRNRLYGIQAL